VNIEFKNCTNLGKTLIHLLARINRFWTPAISAGIALIFLAIPCYSQKGKLNLNEHVFSTFGSTMAISQSKDKKREGLYITDVSGGRLWSWSGIFKIELLNDTTPVPYQVEFTPHKLSLKGANNELVEFAFEGTNILRLRAQNTSIRLTESTYDWNRFYIPIDENSLHFRYGDHANYYVKNLSGDMKADGVKAQTNKYSERPHLTIVTIPKRNGLVEMAISQYLMGFKVPTKYDTFDSCVEANKVSFTRFLGETPQVAPQYSQLRSVGAYLNWSSVVQPSWLLKRNTMLMSKVNMRALWSWDHCFNALASAKNKELAYDQYYIPFDFIDQTGAIPDLMLDGKIAFSYVKPPIHGWALDKLQAKGVQLSKPQLLECYTSLEKWTQFWFTYMDHDQNGFPQYNFGNDSGWDNATPFDLGYAIESADLMAFLALQMESLSNLAQKLGKPKEAAAWKSKSQKLIKDMISYFWDGKRFVAKRTIDKAVDKENLSLMRFLPLVLGSRLPKDIRTIMLADLQSSRGNLTEHGLASESPASTFYEPDGYWRGPIWAPTTYLIVDGLRSMGEHELAKSIALKYCDLCNKNGFAENFDAKTGSPLRDTGYTWTVSVFLLLANEYMDAK
jgi:hypothetical protein